MNQKENDQKDKTDDQEKQEFIKQVKDVLWLGTLGINLVVCTVLGLFFGIYLDKWLGTDPIFTIIFMILGIAAGARGFYRAVKKYL